MLDARCQMLVKKVEKTAKGRFDPENCGIRASTEQS